MSGPDSEDLLLKIANAAKAARHAPHRADSKAILEEKRLFGAAKRAERFESCVHWVTVIGVVASGLTVIAVFCIFAVHQILPPSAQWMTKDQVQSVSTFLFSGLVGSTITQGVKKLQDKHRDGSRH